MRNNFKPPADRIIAEALAAKNLALKSALAYIEAQGGGFAWWKDELAYRTHRRVQQALELPEAPEINLNQRFHLAD